MSPYNKINTTEKSTLQCSCKRRVKVGLGLTTIQVIQDLEIAEIGD